MVTERRPALGRYGVRELHRNAIGLVCGAAAAWRAGKGSGLLDDVDIISSVSGGSVTAGSYGWKGPAGLCPATPSSSFSAKGQRHVCLARAQLGSGRALSADILSAERRPGSFLRPPAVPRRQRTGRELCGTDREVLERQQPTLRHSQRQGPRPRGAVSLYPGAVRAYLLRPLQARQTIAASANFPIVFSPIALQNYSRHCRGP